MPDHLSPDIALHAPDTERWLARAADLCRARGARLTETRRQVLALILTADTPSGAYDLLARLRPAHPNAAPPTIYRALDFLLEQGLIHRIERLSAFVPCVHVLEDNEACCSTHSGASHAVHRAQFLICRVCRRAWELEQELVLPGLRAASGKAGFQMETATIEVEGVCAACREKEVRDV